MITRKQYPNHHVFETEIGGRAFTVETGKVAELADAECICRYGDTVVLTTVTCNPIPKAGIDYFPLTIEFEERMYSVGRIPGSFNRREGKPSERGILNSRIIDRPMRPLFDEELRNDTVVTCTVLANDYDNPVEIVASLGASIAIACSDVPVERPRGHHQRCPPERQVYHQPLLRRAGRRRLLRVHLLHLREGGHDRDRGQGSP